MVNITNISGVISISQNGGTPKAYFSERGKYTFMANDSTFQLQIGGDSYTLELADMQINGQTPSSLGEALTLLNAVFLDANSGSGSSGSSYLVYTALLTQSGTDAPVATNIQNEIGAGTWIRNNVGDYRCPTTTPFVPDNIYIQGLTNFQGSGTTAFPILGGSNTLIGYMLFFIGDDGAGGSTIYLNIVDTDGNAMEYSTAFGSSILNLPEIRVYP